MFTWVIKQFEKLMESRSIPRVFCVLSSKNQLSTKSYPKLRTRYFLGVGWYENSLHLMKSKLYGIIFMSTVQQMLVHVSSNKLYIWSQLPATILNLLHRVSTETHCIFYMFCSMIFYLSMGIVSNIVLNFTIIILETNINININFSF